MKPDTSPTGGPSSASPQLAAAKAVAPSLPQAERVALPASTIGLAVGFGLILFEIALVGAVFFFLR